MHLKTFIVFVIFLFIQTDPACPLSMNDIIDVGCFSTVRVKTNRYYEVGHMLTWEECVQFCYHRLTRYAGIQAEDSSSTDNYCFCGNDLSDKQQAISRSACPSCLGNTDKHCGGINAIAVYQVRESTPFSVAMASDSGVKLLTGGSTTALTIVQSVAVSGVKFLYDEDAIFFISASKVHRSFYNHRTLSYELATKLTFHNYLMLDIVVDWKQNRIVWTNGNSDYAIYQGDLQGGNVTKIVQRSAVLRNLAIDSYRRMLFFVESENKLFSYSLETESLHLYHNGKFHMHKIKKIAVDPHHQLIYVIGTIDDNSDLFLQSIDYADTKTRVLFNGPQLTEPYGLDVFNKEVAWINHEDNKYSMYKCSLTPRCQPENLVMAYQSLEKISDITILHPERQTPDIDYLCVVLSCSHGCEIVSLFVAKCTCPPSMVMGKDNKTCQDHTIQREDTGPVGITSVFDDPEAEGPPIEELVLGKNDKPLTEQNALIPNTHVSHQAFESPKTNNKNAHDFLTEYFEFFVLSCFITIFILLLAVIHLQLNCKRGNNHVSHNSRIPEPEDTTNAYLEIFNMSSKKGLVT